MDLRRPGPFALFILVAHVLARFLGVAAHELLGHATAALALGGSAYGVYLSPGSGFTFVWLPQTLPAAGIVAMQGAGIAVECLLGILIWWRTRRSPSFPWRVFGLVVASVFVVYSLVYMAAGAFDFFPGDTWGIVSVLQDPILAVGFLVAGGVWTLLSGTFISLDVVRLFEDEGADLMRGALMLILFWIVPAPLAFLPGFAASTLLEGSVVATAAAFVAFLAAVVALVAYAGRRLPGPRPAPSAGVPWRPIAAAAIPLLFIVPVWIGVFGVSAADAKGVLLETPPVGAEESWLGDLAVNLNVVVHSDYNVTVVWEFRGTFVPGSPLEAAILSSFDHRMDRELYDGMALTYIGAALNESSWAVASTEIDPNGTVWSNGRLYPDARVVILVPDAHTDPTRFLSSGPNGSTILTVHDPFKNPLFAAAGGWLDSLNVTWQDPLWAQAYRFSGGQNPTEIRSANYVLWRSFNRFQAPETYQVVFGPL